jgi:mono/diheme cytochrome c family protein
MMVAVMRSPVSRVVTLSTLALVACPKPGAVRGMEGWSEAEAGPDKAQPAESSQAPEPSEMARVMHERFVIVASMRDALIHGDVGGARDGASELDHHLEEATLAAGWEPRIKSLRTSLAQFEGDVEIADAAAHLAQLGTQCGSCHQSEGVEASVPEPAAPAAAEDPESRMALHAWAAARMWEGLVRPDDDDWVRGTTTFLALPGCAESYPDATGPRRELCRYVRGLAIPSHLAEDASRKADLYGRLVSTCADCHAVSEPGAGR